MLEKLKFTEEIRIKENPQLIELIVEGLQSVGVGFCCNADLF